MVYSKKAENLILKLPEDIRLRVITKIESAMLNPFHFFDRLDGCELYKLRVGDYRVIVEIDVGERMIYVRLVAHRKNVYLK